MTPHNERLRRPGPSNRFLRPAAARTAIKRGGAVLLTAVLAGCGGGGGPTKEPPNTVRVANFAFSPQTLTVTTGTTVTWDFHQPDAPHNVATLTGPSGFNSGAPQGRGTYTFSFTLPGTYTYICLVHPSMRGTVIVE